MSPSALVAIEIILVLVVAVGFGVWQVVSVRRELARDRAEAARRVAAETAAETAERRGDPPAA